MKLGYARVSTEEQNLNRQLDILNSVNCDKIFAEKISGIKNERPELNKLISSLNIGDIIIITDLTRLSRSVKELFSIVEKVEEKGANIKSLKESWLDTTTIEGLIASRARGKKGGRPPKSKQDINLAIQMYNSKKYKISEITELTKVSKSTIYRYLNKI